MISKRELQDIVAQDIDGYRGNLDERTADIIIERNLSRGRRGDWGDNWTSAMSGGGLDRYEAEARRQCAEILLPPDA